MQKSRDPIKNSTLHKDSTPQSRLLEITREFRVPVERLFQAFKTSEAIQAWWWPKGLYTDRVELDFSEGGHYFINMKGHDSAGGMTGEFEEIVENRRIVMSDSFADKNGKAISAAEAKVPGQWPEMVFITFEFAMVDSQRSQLALSQQGIPNEAQSDCMQGWNQMFDKLEKYLGQHA